MKQYLKTPISYYGGKQNMLPHILPLIPPHRVYTEVFFGGGSVFFAKHPSEIETINDTNDFVINFYRQLKCNYKELNRLIQSTLVSRSVFREAQKVMKDPEAKPVKLAWAFWTVTNCAFSNKIGGGLKYSNIQNNSVPRTIANKKKRFTEYLVARMENTIIENKDALDILESRNVDNAFHYIDPPYVGANQGHYKGYTPEHFQNLLEVCRHLKGKWLISSYPGSILNKYIQVCGWHTLEIEKPMSASLKKNGQRKIEVLTANYDIHNIQQQTTLFHLNQPR